MIHNTISFIAQWQIAQLVPEQWLQISWDSPNSWKHSCPRANPHLYTEHDVYSMEYFHWPAWAVCLAVLPPSSCAPAHQLNMGDRKKSLTSWQQLKTSAYYQRLSRTKSKIQQQLGRKLTLSQRKPGQGTTLGGHWSPFVSGPYLEELSPLQSCLQQPPCAARGKDAVLVGRAHCVQCSPLCVVLLLLPYGTVGK